MFFFGSNVSCTIHFIPVVIGYADLFLCVPTITISLLCYQIVKQSDKVHGKAVFRTTVKMLWK